jgi:hypothetical protein
VKEAIVFNSGILLFLGQKEEYDYSKLNGNSENFCGGIVGMKGMDAQSYVNLGRSYEVDRDLENFFIYILTKKLPLLSCFKLDYAPLKYKF